MLGSRVRHASGEGTVRFKGTTSFAVGQWVGVELDSQNGKNDGSVAGTRYFNCEMGRGIFCKPSAVTPIAAESLARSRGPTSTTTSRPSSRASLRPAATINPSRPTSATSSSSSTAPLPTRQKSQEPAPSAPRVAATAGSRMSLVRRPSVVLATAPVLEPSQEPPEEIVPPPPAHEERRGEMLPPPVPLPRTVPVPTGTSRISRPSSPVKKPALPIATSPLPAASPRRPSVVSPSGSTASMQGRRMSLAPSTPSRALPATVALASPLLLSPSPLSPSPVATPSPSLLAEKAMLDRQMKLEQRELLLAEREREVANPYSLKGTDSRALAEAMVPKKTHEELLAKLRILESRRQDDREKLREAERMKADAEGLGRGLERSKVRIAELSTELKELRALTKSQSATIATSSATLVELTESTELALLDKEMAEETLESTLAEADELREELARERERSRELEERVKDVEIGGGDEEGREGRLKEALSLLRDHSRAQAAQIAALASGAGVDSSESLESLEAELTTSLLALEAAEEERDMLLGRVKELEGRESEEREDELEREEREEMAERLVEVNLDLTEKLTQMEQTVEELEQLAELNDELERGREEGEKGMLVEIDLKDLDLAALRQRNELLQSSIAEHNTTISLFRELVITLQTELESTHQSSNKQATATEALSVKTQEVLSQNLLLRSDVQRTNSSALAAELSSLKLDMASSELVVVKNYLPPAFAPDDEAAVRSLLFFERMAGKVRAVSQALGDRASMEQRIEAPLSSSNLSLSLIRGKLLSLASSYARFGLHLRRASVEEYLLLGKVGQELAGGEKRLDGLLVGLGKGDFAIEEGTLLIDGLQAQLTHLSSLHLPIERRTIDLGESQLAAIGRVGWDLEAMLCAVGWGKQLLVGVSLDTDVLKEGDDAGRAAQLQELIGVGRAGRVVVRKLSARLETLVKYSKALSVSHSAGVETLAFNSSALLAALSRLAFVSSSYLTSVRASKEAFRWAEIETFIERAAQDLGVGGKREGGGLAAVAGLVRQLCADLETTLAAAGEAAAVVQMAYTPPWIARVKLIREAGQVNELAERQLASLAEEMKDLVKTLRVKETANAEQSVKIEIMSARMLGVKKQSEALAALELELAKAKRQELSDQKAIEGLNVEVEKLEEELGRLRKEGGGLVVDGRKTIESDLSPTDQGMRVKALMLQIESLRAAVRFLREENAGLKAEDLLDGLEELPRYSSPTPAAPTMHAGVVAMDTGPGGRGQASKELWREAQVLLATPRLVDLHLAPAPVAGTAELGGLERLRRLRDPKRQLERERDRYRVLERKVGLLELRRV